MSEFKSCPFCGGDAFMNLEGRKFWIECRGCAAETGCFKTEDEAIEAWNTRAERECEPTEDWHCPCGQDLVSCDTGIGPNGGAVELDPPILFNYCPNCGAKVIRTT